MLQHIMKALALIFVALSTLLILCCIGGFGFIKLSIWQSDQAIKQTLATQIDQHFTSVQKPLSSSTADSVIIPATIGSFQRSGVSINSDVSCGHNSDKADKALSANYSTVWIFVTLCKGKAQDYLYGMVGQASCAPDMGGEYRLRETIANSYLYHVCTDLAGNGLVGITWANGYWLITVTGNSRDIAQFLRDYPY